MLAPWKKSYDKSKQNIKKQRHHFADKGPSSQSYVCFFPVVMYGCESWTIKKAGYRRIDALELWCWRRLLVEREVGGGIGMGKTCKLKDVSFQCMTKFTTKKKIK